jgi:hypothetical protein
MDHDLDHILDSFITNEAITNPGNNEYTILTIVFNVVKRLERLLIYLSNNEITNKKELCAELDDIINSLSKARTILTKIGE